MTGNARVDAELEKEEAKSQKDNWIKNENLR